MATDSNPKKTGFIFFKNAPTYADSISQNSHNADLSTPGTNQVAGGKKNIIPAPGPENIPATGPENIPATGQENIPATGQENIPAPGPENIPAPGPENIPAPGPENIPATNPGLEKQKELLDSKVDEALAPENPLEQLEETVMLYIKLMDPADKYFLQYQKIYDNGEKYIAYLKSEAHLKYIKDRKLFDAKYSNNKKFAVSVNKRKIYAYRRDKNGEVDKTESGKVDSLARPTYINIQDILTKAHKTLSQTRINLDSTYTRLLDRQFIQPESKAAFIKARDSLISKLNDYYAIQYFFNKVNGINQSAKIISLPKIIDYYSENAGTTLPRIIAKDINITQDDINKQYTHATSKLELYNKIKEMMVNIQASSDAKELKELIKAYITFDEQNRELEVQIEKKKGHSQINYIVIPPGLEITDNHFLKPRDLKPFYSSAAKNKASRFKSNTIANNSANLASAI